MASFVQIKPLSLSSTYSGFTKLREVHVQGLSTRTVAWQGHRGVSTVRRAKSKLSGGPSTNGRLGSAVATSTETSQFAKEMERVAAKEALLLSIADAGGIEALTSGKGSPIRRIEVAERIIALERLNPTPRPTTSPLLEGVWEFKWAGARSPGVMAARILLKRLPAQIAAIDSLTLTLTDGSATATAAVKLLSSVVSTFSVTSRLAYESPLRLKEEYSEGLLTTPIITEGDVPSQLKSILDSAKSAVESLPASIKDTLQTGLKIPLAGTYQRQLLISYLDDEVLVARNEAGVPDVLLRVIGSEDSGLTANDYVAVSPDASDPTDYES